MINRTLLKSFLAAAVAGGIALSAHAQSTILSEDFESGIGNWTLGTGGSLDTGLGNPGQSGAHDGSAAAHLWSGAGFSIVPGTDGLTLRLTADIFHTGVGNQRNTVGLRTGANPLFEMGHYNNFTVHAGDPIGSGMGVRILNFAGNEGWISLANAAAGWNTWQADFSGTALTVRIDLGATGAWDVEYTSTGSATGAFTDLRFGGPSALSSAGGGFNVDNISLQTVPEPSTYAAIFGGLALLGAFVYRRRLSVKK